MSGFPYITGALVVASLAAAIAGASAAETGTKTFPTSSVNPPHYGHLYNYVKRHHHVCNLPSGHCDNNHRVQN
jgi:hypothetical protein